MMISSSFVVKKGTQCSQIAALTICILSKRQTPQIAELLSLHSVYIVSSSIFLGWWDPKAECPNLKADTRGSMLFLHLCRLN